ncbi:MAG: hypothetical protein K8F91_18575 [Candidatus Obscuribacterales bacterium]|nr:hypothetical protein [Candidatus Obscuribacterales bacterium]
MTHDQILESDFYPITISSQEAKKLELELKTHPNKAMLHFKLAGFYFVKKLSLVEEIISIIRPREDWLPKPFKRHEEHVLWLIGQIPDDPLMKWAYVRIYPEFNPTGYKKAKSLWLQKIDDDPKNLSLLSNAANFFEHANPNLAREILLRALKLDKTNEDFLTRISKLKIRKTGA